MTDVVLVDTNVFTARLRPTSTLAAQYERHLVGRRLAVAPQTVAEARYGALKGGWGAVRLDKLHRLLGQARVLPVDIATVEAVADLRNRCRMAGHALHQLRAGWPRARAEVDARRWGTVAALQRRAVRGFRDDPKRALACEAATTAPIQRYRTSCRNYDPSDGSSTPRSLDGLGEESWTIRSHVKMLLTCVAPACA